MSAAPNRPALLGGQPLRPAGPPPWPRSEPWLTESLQEAIRDGSWGRYHGPWRGRLAEALRQAMQREHVQLTCSGTAAVELALRASGCLDFAAARVLRIRDTLHLGEIFASPAATAALQGRPDVAVLGPPEPAFDAAGTLVPFAAE